MPLIKSKSPGAFKANVRTLMGEVGESPHVQSRKQALAIAYSVKRRGKADGGPVEGFAFGGLIKSAIPGRTDKIPMSVASGSYVLPADIPSAIGQGNTNAGAAILGKMFKSGPYGSGATGGIRAPRMQQTPRMNLGMQRMPSMNRPMHMPTMRGFASGGFNLPHIQPMPRMDLGMHRTPSIHRPMRMPYLRRFAEGGNDDGSVPIIVAGGEMVIPPDVVKDIGHGDIDAGHKVLDKFVLHTRAKHIKTLKGLKPPKK